MVPAIIYHCNAVSVGTPNTINLHYGRLLRSHVKVYITCRSLKLDLDDLTA